MLRYYVRMLLGIPAALMASPKHARAIIGNVFLIGVAIVFGLQCFMPDKAEELHQWLKLGQSSPSVAAIGLGIAAAYLLLLANYEQYAKIEADRDALRDEIALLKG